MRGHQVDWQLMTLNDGSCLVLYVSLHQYIGSPSDSLCSWDQSLCPPVMLLVEVFYRRRSLSFNHKQNHKQTTKHQVLNWSHGSHQILHCLPDARWSKIRFSLIVWTHFNLPPLLPLLNCSFFTQPIFLHSTAFPSLHPISFTQPLFLHSTAFPSLNHSSKTGKALFSA